MTVIPDRRDTSLLVAAYEVAWWKGFWRMEQHPNVPAEQAEAGELSEAELEDVSGGLSLVEVNAPVTNVVQLNLAVLSGLPTQINSAITENKK